MTKDVIISISGLQYDGEEDAPVPVEIISAADYYLKNNTHYILYDEVSEDFSGTTKNMIKLKPDSIEITKKGLSTVNMVFEEGKKNHTCYQTPYGSLFVAIIAYAINIKESDEELSAEIEYELEINSQPLADCKIQIKVNPKENTNLLQ